MSGWWSHLPCCPCCAALSLPLFSPYTITLILLLSLFFLHVLLSSFPSLDIPFSLFLCLPLTLSLFLIHYLSSSLSLCLSFSLFVFISLWDLWWSYYPQNMFCLLSLVVLFVVYFLCIVCVCESCCVSLRQVVLLWCIFFTSTFVFIPTFYNHL